MQLTSLIVRHYEMTTVDNLRELVTRETDSNLISKTLQNYCKSE